MADPGTVRVELAFEGGQTLVLNIAPEAADGIEQALAGSAQGTHQLETEDGRVSISLPRVLYAKRYARDSRVGFGQA